MSRLSFLVISSLLFFLSQGCLAGKFTFTNSCGFTVWPGILSSAGTAPLSTTGFELSQSESKDISIPTNWSGRLWGRTHCATDSTNKFTCDTGDCGSGTMECSGGGAAPPATLAEFTLDGSGGMDFYDVSLVDGYNLPMMVSASAGNCSATGCAVDLNSACPADLKVASASGNGESVACRSACEAFGSAAYCCSGEYGNPNTCKPSSYSLFFKNACPRAYSYAYDDATSTFTCANGGDYVVTFCPTAAAIATSTPAATSKKSTGENPEAVGGVPALNERMVFLGGADIAGSAAITRISTSVLACVVMSSFVLLGVLFH